MPWSDAAQAVVAVVVGGDLLLEPHGPELGDRPRGEPVAAGLLAGEGLLLDDDDVATGSSQPVARRGPSGTTADDEHVVAVGRWSRFSLRSVRPEPQSRPGQPGARLSSGMPAATDSSPRPRPLEGEVALGDGEQLLVLLALLRHVAELDPLVEHDLGQLLVGEARGGPACCRR
jgi:hypothetical protein